ncbi:MAG: RDD family protein [Acidobacteriaceae bacterium]
MSSAAQREDRSEGYRPTGAASRSALKQLAAERLAAHRSRRPAQERGAAQAETPMEAQREAARAEAHPEVARVREAVAARYRQSESYREFLAREAERALEQAQAQAEMATRTAKAVAEAQRQLLDEMERWGETAAVATGGELPGKRWAATTAELVEEKLTGQSAKDPARRDDPASGEKRWLEQRSGSMFQSAAETIPRGLWRQPSDGRESPLERRDAQPGFEFAATTGPADAFSPAQLQVLLPGEVGLALPVETHCAPLPQWPTTVEELAELDEEIEFRRAPEFDDILLEPEPIPANIIEFPRELVAPRKARPRLAEGPLRGDGVAPGGLLRVTEAAASAERAPASQLRIFEVEPEQISTVPEASVLTPELTDAPVWQGMMLNEGPAAEARLVISAAMEEQLHPDQPIYAAPVRRRILSAGVDLACVGSGLAAACVVAVRLAGNGSLARVPRPVLTGSGAVAFVVFLMMYQVLFFSLNEATPGMRAARLAFCSFQERNPSRREMRRRLIATALAACPLGLGLVWMVLDHDSLGWHDRMSRMYPRAY